MSDPSIEVEVMKIVSKGDYTKVKFANLTAGKRLKTVYRNKFTVYFEENPGWDEGQQIEVPFEKLINSK